MIEARRQQIMEEIKKQKFTKVSDLAIVFDVSQVTIRKYLQELEAEGAIVRYHGKIALAESPAISYNVRSKQNNHKKIAIAKVAADMIRNARTVALDAGTTTTLIAQEIAKMDKLSIVTNSLMVANTLEHSTSSINIVGGQMVGQSMCTVGPDAEEYLGRIKTELAFVGCTGVRGTQGLCTGLRLEGSIKQAIMRTGERVVAVFDDSKFQTASMYVFSDFSNIDTIITTRPEVRPEAMDRIEELGIQVIYADEVLEQNEEK